MSSFTLKKVPVGPLNSDSAEFVLPSSAVRYRLNMRAGSGADKSVGVLQNIAGNSEIEFDLPGESTNKCIGTYVDSKNHKCYLFIYNSGGYHGIYEFDYLANTVTPVLISRTDSDDVDILNFSETSRINHINLADGESFTDTVEVVFSLTTGDDLSGTFAELLSTGDVLTESDDTSGTESSNVTLALSKNQVSVTTDKLLATSITVNGEVRENPSLVAGTWTEVFLVSGMNDISVTVDSSTTPVVVSGPATGTWSFANNASTNLLIGAQWNDGSGYASIGSLAPDTFTLSPGQAGSDVAPGGIDVNAAPLGNTLAVTTSVLVSGFVNVTIGGQPVQTFPITPDVTVIPNLTMNPSDNIAVTITDAALANTIDNRTSKPLLYREAGVGSYLSLNSSLTVSTIYDNADVVIHADLSSVDIFVYDEFNTGSLYGTFTGTVSNIIVNAGGRIQVGGTLDIA